MMFHILPLVVSYGVSIVEIWDENNSIIAGVGCNMWINFITLTLLISQRADYRFASSQWEMVLLCNDISHWLAANLESALSHYKENINHPSGVILKWSNTPAWTSQISKSYQVHSQIWNTSLCTDIYHTVMHSFSIYNILAELLALTES